MENTVVKEVLSDDIDILMAASMLVDSTRDIIQKIIIIPDINISNEKFQILLDNYIDKYMHYEFLKTEISKKYIDDIDHVSDWSINFNSKKIYITQ